MQNKTFLDKHLILLGLMLSAPTFAQGTQSDAFTLGLQSTLKKAGIKDLNLNIGANFGSLDSRTDQTTAYETNMNIELEAEVIDSIDFKFDGGFRYQTGNSATQEEGRVRTFKPKFSYNYGYFNYRPVNFARISVGALDNSTSQQYISPFVNGGTSFLGAREVMTAKLGNFYFRLQATQAQPQNALLRETFNIDDNGDPQFFNESLDITFLTKGFKVFAAAGTYRYKNLSADVADNDYFWGNSVSKGASPDQSLYLYDFTGVYANAGMDVKIGSDLLKLKGSYIKNNEAAVADDKNSGFAYGAEYKTSFGDKKITFKALAFENQADTAPAFYRGGQLANDYEGYSVGLGFESTTGFNTEFNYTNRTVLGNTDSVYLIDGYSDEQIYTISLRKEYDIL